MTSEKAQGFTSPEELGVTRYDRGDPALWYRGDPKPNFRRSEIIPHVWKDRSSGFVAFTNQSSSRFSTLETLYSVSNQPFWGQIDSPHGESDGKKAIRRLGRVMDVGGPFYMSRDTWIPVARVNVNANNYVGPIGLTGIQQEGQAGKPPNLVSTPTSLSTLKGLGTTAISRCAPTNPNANLATALGELRNDGLPSLPLLSFWKDRTKDIRQNVGSEYLNYQFGWKPMISDIQATAHALRNSQEILQQFIKDSDKGIRRRYHFPEERSTSQYDSVQFLTGSIRTGYTLLWGTVTDETVTKRWFSGEFKYHVPGGSDALSSMRRREAELNYLLGTRITPEVLWNLSPWTWMVDWFGNIGDIMSNVSRFGTDSMAMRYGYMMETKEVTRHMESSFNGKKLYTRRHLITKRRITATPYGFDTTFSSLSAKQWSILAALGLQARRR